MSNSRSTPTRRGLLRSAVSAAAVMVLGRPARGLAAAARRATGGPATFPQTQEIFSWIKDLSTNGFRRTGTRAGRESEDYLVRHFRKFGLSQVHVQRTKSRRWQPKKWALTVDGQAIKCFPVAHSFAAPHQGFGPFSTGKKGLSAPLVDVGLGTQADFAANDVKGKIVLFDLKFLVPRGVFLSLGEWNYNAVDPTRPQDAKSANPYLTNFSDVTDLAVQNGAVGFVGVLADYWNSNKYFPEYFPVPIPGLWVSPQEGARIRSLSSPPTAIMRLEGAALPATAGTVIGILPGQGSDAVMIQSHHDTVWDGGVEDASGTAEVLALAKYFSQVPRANRPKTLMFVLMDSHFTGYQAHDHFVRSYIKNPKAKNKIVANVTIEHIAKQAEIGADGGLVLYDKPEYRGIFENVSDPIKQAIKDAVTQNGLVRTVLINTDELFPVLGELPTDADAVYRADVPTISFISGPLYLYDKADTPDTVYQPDLVPVAKAFAAIVEKIAATPSAEIG